MTTEIKNWKLKELKDDLTIISDDGIEFIYAKITELNLPEYEGPWLNRKETYLNWEKMHPSYQIFFDYEGGEQEVKNRLSEALSDTDNVIIPYGPREPTVLLPSAIFVKHWDDIFQSTRYQTVIFDGSFDFIMEISRDYYLYSNFKI